MPGRPASVAACPSGRATSWELSARHRELSGFLDRVPGFNRGFQILDIHVGPVGTIVDVHRASRFSLPRSHCVSLRGGRRQTIAALVRLLERTGSDGGVVKLT